MVSRKEGGGTNDFKGGTKQYITSTNNFHQKSCNFYNRGGQYFFEPRFSTFKITGEGARYKRFNWWYKTVQTMEINLSKKKIDFGQLEGPG